MELNWSRWSRCESSFGLLLAPNQPGVFALAEEIVESSGPDSRRLLAVFEINEAENLAQVLSRLFAQGSAWQERLTQARCYLRYVVITDADKRRDAADALKRWLNSQFDAAALVFEQSVRGQQEAATVAERAVDTVVGKPQIGRNW
ncbi:MAG TPA: hypothetical protein VI685_24550 [Candidatus Angelobacter sp.]